MSSTEGRAAGHQSLHDVKVRQLADELIAAGWDVRAHVGGYAEPDAISGCIPDIHAARLEGGVVQELIIEVETEDTVDEAHAKSQAAAFRTYAALSSRRRFELVVAQP